MARVSLLRMSTQSRKGCCFGGCLGTIVLFALLWCVGIIGGGAWLYSGLPERAPETPRIVLTDEEVGQVEARLQAFLTAQRPVRGMPTTLSLDAPALNGLLLGTGEPGGGGPVRFLELEGEDLRCWWSLPLVWPAWATGAAPFLQDRHLTFKVEMRPVKDQGEFKVNVRAIRLVRQAPRGDLELPPGLNSMLDRSIHKALLRDPEAREAIAKLHQLRVEAGMIQMRSRPIMVPRGALR